MPAGRYANDKPRGAPDTTFKYIVLRHPEDCVNWRNTITTLHDTAAEA